MSPAFLADRWASSPKAIFLEADALDTTSFRAVIILGSIALFVVAAFITFLGYKHFSTALVLQGAILGGYMGWYIGSAFADSSETKSVMVHLSVAIVLGLFLAVFTCCMKGVMRFLFGFALGVQIGSVANIVWLHSLTLGINESNPNNLGYVVMAAVGLVLGALAFVSGRKGHIVLTAWVGAYWVIQAVGNFFGKYVVETTMCSLFVLPSGSCIFCSFPSLFYPFPQDARTATVSTSYFIYIGAWVLLAVGGMATQLHLTTFDSNYHDMVDPDDADDISLEKDLHKSHTPYKNVQDVSV
ncbi:hypothetical protein H257_10027 [Aphanomyces astaci]|uniref:Transmembrane protein 198 n=1 Tax=Aphanomyces astaci TaxID=112090 RepID=W4G8M9_APHAT|nr:hypothetical protein H257_10027 [Aphanomyces astaci]ETV75626.1 hypothetical protein H257_10027 [Aphanomyces astaci]|eukprot:XP_009834757.1 hypothetical protein H257_10027 [Aphanomyces astaci]